MLDSLFNPSSVAIIGASSRDLHIGNRIIKNLLSFGYTGKIYPINPKSSEICGIKAYKSILDIKDDIDLVHIVIPAKFVPMAVEDCSNKGVKNIIINSGGFSEIGEKGALIQSEFMQIAREKGIRILGPNCQGIINSDPAVKAYCNFTFTFPKPGTISIVALSGGVAELIHQGFVSAGVGTRMYASNGNACDISISEIIRYLGDDSSTHVIVTYVEGLEDYDNFFNALKDVRRKKPILAMKAGRTTEGARAAASHTGILAKKDLAIDLIFKKAGVMTFTHEAEMINAAMLLATQPMPNGNRVGVITNTGGPAVIATDVLVESGLIIPELSNKATELLKVKLHKGASVSNPVDLLATGLPEHYKECLQAMIFDENIDSIFISFITPFFVDTEAIAKEIVLANSKHAKPIVCNLMTDSKEWVITENILKDGGVPCFNFPSDAASALARLVQYKNILNSDSGVIKTFVDVDHELVLGILNKANQDGQKYLLSDQVYTVLDAYGIRIPAWKIANNVKDVLKAADEIGYPVVIKADSTSLIHKSDLGGVILNLSNEIELKQAILEIEGNIKSDDLRFFVQKYISGGVEFIFGAKYEAGLGHAIMFGLGGIFVEVIKDVVFNLAPVTDLEVMDMINSMKNTEVISGVRGREGTKIVQVIELIQRLSQFVSDFDEIGELDLNPVVTFEKDLLVLDARIILR